MKILMIDEKTGDIVEPGTVRTDFRGDDWTINDADQRGANRIYCTHSNGITRAEFFPSVLKVSLIEETIYKASRPEQVAP